MQDQKQYYIDLTRKYINMYSALESACLWGKNLTKDMFDLYYATCHAVKKFTICIYRCCFEECEGENDNFDIILAGFQGDPQYEKMVDSYIAMTCLEERIELFLKYMSKPEMSVGITEISPKK